MAKSFSEYYKEDSVKPVLPEVTEIPEMPTVKRPRQERQEPVVETVNEYANPEPVNTVDKSETILEALKEQRDESEKIIQSLTESNNEMASSVTKLVESANETNNKLLEAIVGLSEKVSMLEGKLDEIKNLEIPTPIVNLQMPGKKVTKRVHRDEKGMITHVEESESFEDSDNDEE